MRTWSIAAILGVGLLAACAGDPAAPAAEERTQAPSSTAPTTPSPEPSSPPPSSRSGERGPKIVAAESDFGPILFDDKGQAIYVFDVETTSRPRCYGPCAVAWPPVLTRGAPLAGERVQAGLLGTTERSDGTTQVTYDGQPLYFYAHEGREEVTCHDVFLNGGTWYAVQPDGGWAPTPST